MDLPRKNSSRCWTQSKEGVSWQQSAGKELSAGLAEVPLARAWCFGTVGAGATLLEPLAVGIELVSL